MIVNENRFLVSDSIKDDVELGQTQVSKVIPLVSAITFVPDNGIPEQYAFSAVLRSIGVFPKKIEIKITCRVDTGLMMLNQINEKSNKLYQFLFIEHAEDSYRVGTKGFHVSGVFIETIDSEKHTCTCNILFKRDKVIEYLDRQRGDSNV